MPRSTAARVLQVTSIPGWYRCGKSATLAVERRFRDPAIESPSHEGWAWWELADSQASRADLDASKLLAVLLGHWDNKSENQRLVCGDGHPGAGSAQQDQARRCARPTAMIQDLGATFGPTTVSLARWREMPVWEDPTAPHCPAGTAASTASISSMTLFILPIVSCSGSSAVMSIPASLSRSIGYFEPPELMKVR